MVKAFSDKPSLQLDVEYFDRILNRPDIPTDMRHEALKQLWQLIGLCIDVGIGVYPMPKNGGEFTETSKESADSNECVIDLNRKVLSDTFREILDQKEHRE